MVYVYMVIVEIFFMEYEKVVFYIKFVFVIDVEGFNKGEYIIWQVL